MIYLFYLVEVVSLVNYYKYDQIIFPEINGVKKPICPACIGHRQIEPNRNDCKNVFFMTNKDGSKEVVGQCCCYSEEHN